MKTVVSFFALVGFALMAQQESTRQLWNEEFMKQRPASKAKPAANPQQPDKRSTLVGVTLWRLRAPSPKDSGGTRLLVLDKTGAASGQQTLERIESGTQLAEGDKVRLVVEASRAGYLYVIDRERYQNGSMSDAYLIYPNSQTRPGDNALAAGRIIEIPDQRDTPNHFIIQARGKDRVGEVLTLIISAEPLEGLKAGQDPLRLDPAVYADWEKKWTAPAEKSEMEGGAGKTWTEKEKAAGADHNTVLTQDDPL